MEPTAIPPVADIRRLLEGITVPRLRELAAESGVPFGTIYKIAAGSTLNPGIETVRRFYPHALTMAARADQPAAAARQAAGLG